ncbi:Aminotriazole resistance protein [Cyberlindnera fabianii]|uniref:Aminotriazole resistance protein n=1 Tax=Cyberlindnera fabianii TaxID=36022 RepID=A0A1V2LDL8_CYBFA|nr:Aminotriazole resistance protein [Cyberlindnera fabianii]
MHRARKAGTRYFPSQDTTDTLGDKIMGFLNIGERPPAFKSAIQEWSVILVVCLAQVLNQMGASEALPMMNVLEKSFTNVTETDKVWFQTAFPLTSGAFILISGKFGDLYGLKRTLMFGVVFSTISTLILGLTGYTTSVIFFCLFRAFQGVGLAYILPSAIGVVGTIYPNGQRKALVFAAVGSMAPVGATIGTLIAGLTAQYNQWQWAYYSTTIAFVTLGVLAWFMVPETPVHAEEGTTMDWAGSVLGVTGLVLFNLATNQAPQVGWEQPYIIVLLIAGVLLMAVFFWVERKVKYPLVPKEVMNLHVGLILSSIGMGWASFSIWMFYYWSILLNLKGWSPLTGAATYATLFTFGIIAAACVGLLIRRVRPSKLLFASASAFLIGVTMLSQAPVHQTYWQMLFPLMVILSFGMDLSFPAASLILSDNLPKKHQGMASSLVSTTINYAMSIANGFAGTAGAKVQKNTGDLLKSYRAGLYVGVGFASLGVLLSFALLVTSYFWSHPSHTDSAEQVDDCDERSQFAVTECRVQVPSEKEKLDTDV